METTENKKYGTYYIAFLDMLGFKQLVSNECKFDFIIRVFKNYKFELMITDAEGNIIHSNETTNATITTKIISDSICLYINADSESNLHCLLYACNMIQWELANFDPPVLLRGGITEGKLYSDGNIIFGPGLTKAYLLEEQNAKVPRIITTNDILLPYRTQQSNYGETTIDRFLFRDSDGFYVIDYFAFINFFHQERHLKERLLNYAESILNSETDSSIREKYLYLIYNINAAMTRGQYWVKSNNN